MSRRPSTQYLSENEKSDIASDSSFTMREDDGLLSEESRHEKSLGGYRGSERRLLNWRVILFVLNILLFITGISLWIHVVVLSKNFHCEKGLQEDKFEPDCMLRRDSDKKVLTNFT